MKSVDIENWNRKDHFNYFKNLDYPHFNICANLDITQFMKYIKEKEYPFFISILYISVRAANRIKEFRYRIRKDTLVEHDLVHPSFTVMTKDEVFSFCTVRYNGNFASFLDSATKEIENTKNNASIEDEPGRDDLLYISSLPWISFTSITHPIHMNPVDSMPRITWGKYFEQHEKILLPFSVQVHHALLDGAHVGQYFTLIQELLSNPENSLGGRI